MKQSELIDKIIKNALNEDIGEGDITTLASIPANLISKGEFWVKQEGIIAGLQIAKRVFELVDPSLKFKIITKDEEKIIPKKLAAIVEGKAASILTAERTALNFLQRMSGIATMANLFSDKIKHTKTQIIDTRKTAPGLRILDKMAVKMGRAENHRLGLYDMFLIKDNHIAAAGSITKAVQACKEFQKKNNKFFKIEVEVKNLVEAEEALNSKADIIMLDNFNLSEMVKAVQFINGKCKIEASVMVNIDTVKDIAETGVDFISVGALTHSVKALDISLEISESQKSKIF